MKMPAGSAALALLLITSPALAADPAQGRVLAQRHCAACHVIAPATRNEVADAPPFDVIGRKYGFDAERVLRAILAPHPRMNFSPGRAEATDLAAYIGTLSE